MKRLPTVHSDTVCSAWTARSRPQSTSVRLSFGAGPNVGARHSRKRRCRSSLSSGKRTFCFIAFLGMPRPRCAGAWEQRCPEQQTRPSSVRTAGSRPQHASPLNKAIWRAAMLLCAGLLFWLLSRSLSISAQGTGVIRGIIANGTSGGGSVEGLQVTLRSFAGDTEGQRYTAATDAVGAFRFEGLSTGSDWSYLLQVEYKGVVYSPGRQALEADQTELTAQVSVYENTTDDRDMGVARAHILIDTSATGVSVTEMYAFLNPTDRTFVGAEETGGRRWTSRFLLPQGSRDLALEDGTLGGRFLAVDGGFVDTEPQWPGTTTVLFSYAVECPTGECNLTRQVAQSIANLNVLIPDTGAQVQSTRLTLAGTQEGQGQSYLNYAGRGLLPGDTLDLRVRLQQPTSPTAAGRVGGSQPVPWIVLGTAVTLLALIYPFWRQRVQATARERR